MRVSHILLLALLALSVATARVEHKNVGHKQDLELDGEADTAVDTGAAEDLSLGEEEESPAGEELAAPAAEDEQLGEGEVQPIVLAGQGALGGIFKFNIS